MSNSNLVDYKKISPNRSSPRNHKIDTITIHCVVGQLSVETIGNVFAPTSRQASSNYAVGSDGRIGMYVEEKDRAWTSSNASNDNRAVTIEVACDTYAPYAVNDKAYNALITLVADICKRNGIKKLLWKADKSLIGQVTKQNMTAHRWFSATACPGDFLYNRFGDIAKRVNEKLGVKTENKTSFKPYFISVKSKTLKVRKDAGKKYAVVATIKKGEIYTIIDEKENGGYKWGKLKSGIGWVNLNYCKKI